MPEELRKIVIFVRIEDGCCGKPTWHFESEYSGLNHTNGRITLDKPGETEITYLLYGLKYKLIFINLDPKVCAARQIHTIRLDTNLNAITIVDTNDWGYIGPNPISLRLIARVGNDIRSAVISPDPEVENNPNDQH